MQNSEFISTSSFAQALAQYCQNEVTGTLYFASSDNRAGAINLERGQIIALRYSSRLNEKAIDALRSLQGIRYNFSKTMLAIQRSQLPINSAIFEKLGLKMDTEPAISPGTTQSSTAEEHLISNIHSLLRDNMTITSWIKLCQWADRNSRSLLYTRDQNLPFSPDLIYIVIQGAVRLEKSDQSRVITTGYSFQIQDRERAFCHSNDCEVVWFKSEELSDFQDLIQNVNADSVRV